MVEMVWLLSPDFPKSAGPKDTSGKILFGPVDQGSKLAGVRESAAPRFLEGLLDIDW